MSIIDTVRLPTRALTTYFRIKEDGFVASDYGLSRDRRSRPQVYSFADFMRAHVAETLFAQRADRKATAAYVEHCDPLTPFLRGECLHVPIRDGKPSLIGDPANGVVISIPLERIGRELGDWFCHHVAATLDPETGKYGGQPAFDAAKADFEARIAAARSAA